MVFNNNLLLGAAGAGSGYVIDQSIRFNNDDTPILSRTLGTPTDRNKFTYSFWVKPSSEANGYALETNVTGGVTFSGMVMDGGSMQFFDYSSGSAQVDVRTAFTGAVKFRDYSAWYHAMFVYDSDQSTDSDRLKFYINGVQFPSGNLVGPGGGSPVWPSSGYNSQFNNNVVHRISSSVNGLIDGYMAEINFIDGQALDPTSFGEYNNDGVWIPKEYNSSYGNNGFYITGATASDLGEDFSGNGNDFTSSGLTTTDQMLDTPTLNYCVMNVLDNGRPGNITVSDGNLTAAFSGAGYQGGIRSSIFFDSEDSDGWYAECTLDSLAFASIFRAGVANASLDLSTTDAQSSADGWAYSDQGAKLNNSYTTGYGSSVGVGDVVGVAVRNGKIYFAVNNVWQGSSDPVAETSAAFTNLTGDVAFCQSTSTGGSYAHTATWNFGQSGFTYTPPTGYKAVNTANLDTPSIRDGSKYFNTVLYEGNGGGQRVGQFQPITETYTVPNSVIFNDNDSASLTRTPSSAGNRRTFTFSCWVKRASLTGANQPIFTASGSSWIMFLSGETLGINFDSSGNYRIVTNQVFKDTSSWFHVVLRVDTTNATADDRLRMYINGSQVTNFGTRTNPPLNADTDWNNTGEHRIGKLVGASQYFDGYLAEINHIDGQSLGPDSFGQLDASTNKWIPKDASGLTFGTNGFYLDMETAPGTGSGAGTDSSGNGNNFTESGLAASDQVTDSPTDNFCVLNPLSNGTGANPSDGNLKFATTSAATGTMVATLPVSSGKWYCEVTVTTGSSNGAVGIRSVTQSSVTTNTLGSQTLDYAYRGNGQKFNSNTKASYGSAYTTGAVVGIALDLDGGTIKFLNDNSDQGIAYSGISGTFVFAVGDDNASSAFAGTFNFGQSAFTYTPPTGFNTLSTDNLPLSNGDLSAFVWIKNRDAADNHMLFDAVRGATKDVHSNASDVEVTNANTLTRFLKNGFEVSNDAEVNTSGESYVAWQWLNDSLTTSSNTDGDITSTVLANTAAGYSIVKYSGNGSDNQEIGHGIGLAPKMIISKRLDASGNWTTYHDAVGINKVFYLNSTAAPASNTEQYRAVPTSSVYTVGVGGDINNASGTYVAYCVAEIPGYSSFGSYTGNGSTDGPFVYTGFTPRFVLFKRTNAAESWPILDTARGSGNFGLDAGAGGDNPTATNDLNAVLVASTTAAEEDNASGSRRASFNSNGFKVRTTNTAMNGSGSTYIYMAFAEHPFGGDGAAPATAR